MEGVFFILGPTATGKSEIAAEVAAQLGAEIVSADAYQLYRGLDLLTGKPDAATRARVPHHLIGAISLSEQMNAERFRHLAARAIYEIRSREKLVLAVGGSGFYVRALTEGLSPLPSTNAGVRRELEACLAEELHARLFELDPATAQTIDAKNRHRLVRALEVCLLSGRPFSQQRQPSPAGERARGCLLFRDRTDLWERIDQRVEKMFADGVIEEVRAASEVGSTAAKTLGFSIIQELIAGRISEPDCIAAIQQATRRYAKRQLTWFRHQTKFEALNLSIHGSSEAIAWIARKVRLSFARPGNDRY